jgi:hypothetical protein
MNLFAKGKILGVATRQQVNRNNGNTWDSHYLVIQAPKRGGVAGQMDDSEFQLTKSQVDSGAVKRLNDMQGSEVLVEVFSQQKESKGRVYITWFLSGDGVPQRINPAQKAA